MNHIIATRTKSLEEHHRAVPRFRLSLPLYNFGDMPSSHTSLYGISGGKV
jgi:hypothetical protein